MKKSIWILLPTFTLGNTAFLSLGLTCLLDLLSLSMRIFLDGSPVREVLFYIVLGIISLLGLVAMVALNIKVSEKLTFTKFIWCFQYISAFVLSIPMIKLWQMLFDFLQKNILGIY